MTAGSGAQFGIPPPPGGIGGGGGGHCPVNPAAGGGGNPKFPGGARGGGVRLRLRLRLWLRESDKYRRGRLRDGEKLSDRRPRDSGDLERE
ncbi:hypothetical protein NLG97_g7641 [Lecanicillium saksenae]|uniref:Uncharacterized protein n=1 Tax=Lecanicillium saksenae TaxID=468837 RepID=A0ACC1QPF6_9HYPO|nr:hypothetical protein NLG97_g7641 [Lecanicillium saksenae]